MWIVFMAALIFGFVHPGSKLILGQGIPLSYFCLLYIGIRLIAQLPFLFRTKATELKREKIIFALISIGLVGALLQLFEFKGVDLGIPPATITFIMFSYPLWILAVNFLSQKHTIGIFDAVQSMAVITGIYLIGQSEMTNLKLNSWALLYPLLASFLIAAWILLSNHLRKEGVGTFHLSAYYDFFSFIVLLVIFSGQLKHDWPQFLFWSDSLQHIYGIVFFSIFVGLLPNFLFYFGNRQVTSHFAGTVLALEPIFSSFYSAALWPTVFGRSFVVGAAFILLANLPKEIFTSIVQGWDYEK